MTNSNMTLTQATDKPALILGRLCDRSQILISIERDDKYYLSPVGWVEAQKGTLLDCRPAGEAMEVIIPNEYAGELTAGSRLKISCFELDFEGELVWQAVSAPAAAPFAKGLLSRLNLPKADTDADLSDTAKRAAQLEKEAEDIRARLERARLAQEEAHARALKAARDAEEARKAEDARIAETEAAKRAMKAAQEARREELLQIEEERRAEQARRAEAARLAEEARRFEEDRRRQAELKAEKQKLLKSADDIEAGRKAAQERARALKAKVDAASKEAEATQTQVKSTRRILTEQSETMREAGLALKSAQSVAGGLEDKVKLTSANIAQLDKQSGDMQNAAAQAKTAYLAAQKAADEALAHAKAMKSKMETAQTAAKTVQGNSAQAAEERGIAAKELSAAQAQTQALQGRYEKLSAKVSLLQSQADQLAAQETQSLEHAARLSAELDAENAQLKAAKSARKAAQDAIGLIDAGEPIEAVRAAASAAVMPASAAVKAAAQAPAPARPRFAPRKRLAALAAVPAAVLHKSDAPDEEPTAVAPDIANDEEAGSRLRRALYAGAATVAIVGVTGLGVSKLWPSSAQASPKTIAQAETTPEPVVETAALTPADFETADVEADADGDIAETDTSAEIAEAKEPDAKNIDIAPQTQKAAPAKTSDTSAKQIAAPKLKPKTVKADVKPAPKIQIARVVEPVKTAKSPVTQARSIKRRVPPKPAPQSVKPTPKPSVPAAQITLVQTKLSELGFYNGSVDGKGGPQTDAAIKDFKTVFGLPGDAKISTRFLSELNSAGVAKTAPVAAPVVASTPVPAPAPMAAVPAAPKASPVVAAPVIAPQPEPAVQVAALTPVTVPSAAPAPDKVIEAKRLVGLKGEYPSRAMRRGYFETVAVTVHFEISETGDVINSKVASLDPVPSRYAVEFEKAGLNAAEHQKFEPKTVNGEPVTSTGHSTRITFKTE